MLYILVFCPTDFFFKAIVFTVCEHDYMNIHPPPPPLSRLVMALLLGNALYEFFMKCREILKPEVAGRYKSLCRDSHSGSTAKRFNSDSGSLNFKRRSHPYRPWRGRGWNYLAKSCIKRSNLQRRQQMSTQQP